MRANEAIHTMPDGDGWAIRREGSSEVLSRHPTKAEAVAAGRVRADAEEVDHLIHTRAWGERQQAFCASRHPGRVH